MVPPLTAHTDITTISGQPLTARLDPRRSPLLRSATELAVAGVVYLVYRLGRVITSTSVDVAHANAGRVMDLERALGAFIEPDVQRWALQSSDLVTFLNRYYVGAHFPVTITALVWMFVFRRALYTRVRNWFITVTLTALAVHVAFPLAPPRMMPGFVDTLAVYGPSIYPDDPSRSLANQFAAMPSLHFGWALMVAVALTRLAPRLSPVWALHPAVTLVAILATANHYWFDAAVATAIAAVAAPFTLRRLGDERAAHEPATEAAESTETAAPRRIEQSACDAPGFDAARPPHEPSEHATAARAAAGVGRPAPDRSAAEPRNEHTVRTTA